MTVLEKYAEEHACSPFTLFYPLALLTMNRTMSEKQFGAELLYLWFGVPLKFSFQVKQ